MRGSSSSSLPRVLASLTGVATVGYTAFVEQDNWRRKNERVTDEGITQNFGVGSADDILSDYLRPGDVVLFSRRWYQHHIPMAVCVKTYQLLHPGVDFDHCGVVIGNDKAGVPLLWEMNPHERPTVEPFPQRILQSKAQHIVLKPISPRMDFTSAELAQALAHANSTAVDQSEFTAMLWSFAVTLVRKLWPAAGTGDDECPSSKLVLQCWDKLGIHRESGGHTSSAVSCGEFAAGAEGLHLHRHAGKVSLGGDILIRTR